ncbi:sigma-54 specific transcriptional regulator, flagellar regulatory protein A [Parasphingorhabdus marina DSM 22363]|uniref:Sigma-54 specific transcriptional regulator, flagellar regulatory protein A n=1 Tax=Parasphingorhabdus marina DSM 22363 TaxID=1123272 RepID=A0A1N6CWN8_9SPHN|nr:sigma-54 dependent transcriptional regulator [Parasphingorhabdus marina]SIN62990.1 sigma-54 specific transcriptional regulator, flagellar regulatory protein A [Parasphingorhabdus marina DSM 22363]
MATASLGSADKQQKIDGLIVGISSAIRNTRKLVRFAADTSARVLITGPSGCGKEVIANALHQTSSRADKPFVAVNCGAIPRELIEAELFGHEKGSFTGATSRRLGHFERAQGGTLFLDEIGDMPMDMQVRLLRVLEDQKIRRVGGDQEIAIDTRIIAATHKDLEAAIAAGTFREDLYYRLSVLQIEASPLHERPEDIPSLLHHFLKQSAPEESRPVFQRETMDALCSYNWPGNARELRNVVERAGVFFAGTEIEPSHLPILLGKPFSAVQKTAPKPARMNVSDWTNAPVEPSEPLTDLPELEDEAFDMKQYLMSAEQTLIKQALKQSGGTVSKAAKLLSLPRTTFIEKMQKLDLQAA